MTSVNDEDPCDRLKATIIKLAEKLRSDPVARESFHQYRLKAEQEYQQQRLELDRFEAASPEERQRMIDDSLTGNKRVKS